MSKPTSHSNKLKGKSWCDFIQTHISIIVGTNLGNSG